MNDPFENVQIDVKEKIEELIKDLEHVNYHIAQLAIDKSALEKKLLEYTKRVTYGESGDITDISHEGQKSHVYGKYRVTIKTDYIYTLNKDEYSIYKQYVPKGLNPVQETTKYEVNKRIFRDAHKYASNDELNAMYKFIVLKPSKPNVKIEANV